MPNDNNFQGEIHVASRIVDYLSSGLYHSPAACLKELINNSFDADATQVNVFVKPDAEQIIIEDNGYGMNKAEFVKNFSLISESHKRDDSDVTPLGRPKIGKIGIGFIAANEICDEMQIISTKQGSDELLDVVIMFDLMRQDPNERRRKETELAKADYFGTISNADPNIQFTQIFLKRIRGEARTILVGAGITEFSSGKNSLYGLSPESVGNMLKRDDVRTWSNFDDYSKSILQVGLNVPVKYHDNWLPINYRARLKTFEDRLKRLKFTLFFDGSEIRKPIVFHPTGRALINRFQLDGISVSAKGYFYAQHGAIKPQELQGLLIRIRHAAVGEYDPSFMGFSSSLGPLFQSWISGEIFVDDRLEDAMNIDRRTLRIAHPAYVELQRAVHKHIASLLKDVRVKIHAAGTKTRKTTQAKRIAKNIDTVATGQLKERSPKVAAQISRTWSKAPHNQEQRKKLLRKFGVDELYDLVIEAAQDVLTSRQLSSFLIRLTELLKK